MKVLDVCKNYFSCNKVESYKKKGSIVINILKVISYFTVVIPLGFAVTYGFSLLSKFISKREKLNSVEDKTRYVFEKQKSNQHSSKEINFVKISGESLRGNYESDTGFSSLPLDSTSSIDPEENSEISDIVSLIIQTKESTTQRPYKRDLDNSEKSAIVPYLNENCLNLVFQKFPSVEITIRRQDIFESEAQVIVNAANSCLGGGSGIDGLIHKRGGELYKQQHKALKEKYEANYPLGFAAMIGSGNLIDNKFIPVKFKKPFSFAMEESLEEEAKNAEIPVEEKAFPIENVIVVAGPQDESTHEKEGQLYSCYYNALVLANNQNIKSIAFPSISTGIFAFPKERAACVSLKALHDFMSDYPETSLKTISIHFLKADKAINLVIYKNALSIVD